jgi:hypothetical protein
MYVAYHVPPELRFPQPPMAGCGSCALRGLGDAAYDAAFAEYQAKKAQYDKELAAYNTTMSAYNAAYAKYEKLHKTWEIEKKVHDKLVASYNEKVAKIDKEFAAASIAAASAIVQWQNKQDAYVAALQKWSAARQAERTANAAATAKIVKAYNLSPPSNFGNCLSQADHDKYKLMCANASVKGLAGYWGDWQAACGMAELPICKTPPPEPKSPGVKPKMPVKPAYPTKPPAMWAEPKPPVKPAITKPIGPPTPPPTPPSVPTPPPTPETPVVVPADEAAELKQKNLVMVGLLAVVAIGGGYAVYRTFKKPKAAA